MFVNNADKDQDDLLFEISDLIKTQKQKNLLKIDTLESRNAFLKSIERILNVFKSGIFPLQRTEETGNLELLARVAHVSDCKFLDPTRL